MVEPYALDFRIAESLQCHVSSMPLDDQVLRSAYADGVAIAEAFYGIPDSIKHNGLEYIKGAARNYYNIFLKFIGGEHIG